MGAIGKTSGRRLESGLESHDRGGYMDSDRFPAWSYRHIEVRPIAGALGAEISGVDASRPLTDEVVAEIRRAWLAHLVIFLRGQQLAPQALVDFASRFGRPMEYPQLKGLAEC